MLNVGNDLSEEKVMRMKIDIELVQLICLKASSCLLMQSAAQQFLYVIVFCRSTFDFNSVLVTFSPGLPIHLLLNT